MTFRDFLQENVMCNIVNSTGDTIGSVTLSSAILDKIKNKKISLDWLQKTAQTNLRGGVITGEISVQPA